jgi:uncharacterized protein (DUF736 family)
MASIGTVARKADGSFTGELATISIKAPIAIIPNRAKKMKGQPDFRVMSGKVEVGAGWTRLSETSGKDYVSLALATPEFGRGTLYANLGRAADQDDDDVFALIWNPAD